MHLRLCLLIAMAASCMASLTIAGTGDPKPGLQMMSDPFSTTRAVQENHRRLRVLDSDSPTEGTRRHSDWVKHPRNGQVFVEHIIYRTLTDPATMSRLFNKWYDDGYTPDEISAGLSRHASRDLDEAFKNLDKKYIEFVRARENVQQTN